MDGESAKHDELSLEGSFVCSVENAVVMEVTNVVERAESYPQKFAEGERVFEVTYDSENVYGVESVVFNRDDMESFIEILYMCQRATDEAAWQLIPQPIEDTYESLIYLQAVLHAEDGREEYEQEKQELSSIDRFKTEPQGWVEEAIERTET